MPNRRSHLDSAALERLRVLVGKMHRTPGSSVPSAELVHIAEQVRIATGITVDFRAAEDLGEPLVVVRVPFEPTPDACLDSLSPREMEVVALIAEGMSNKAIAARLFISQATVKDHVHQVLEKTGLKNRTTLALAYKGLMP